MNARRAMTLVEVLAALAILVILSGGVIGFFLQVTDRRDQLVRLASQQRDVSMFFDRLESALLSAVAVGPDGGAGVSGGERSISLVSRAVSAVLEGDGAVADAARIEFSFDESAARCACTLTALAGDDAPLSEAMIEHVERMAFRYSDGRAWQPSFDTLRAGRLPVAIEVSIWLEPRTGPRAPQPLQSMPGASGAPTDDLLSPEAEELGPMDLPPPEPEEAAWIPREPDHVRVILVPDAPAAGWGGPGA